MSLSARNSSRSADPNSESSTIFQRRRKSAIRSRSMAMRTLM
jgi:hypothetical protein